MAKHVATRGRYPPLALARVRRDRSTSLLRLRYIVPLTLLVIANVLTVIIPGTTAGTLAVFASGEVYSDYLLALVAVTLGQLLFSSLGGYMLARSAQNTLLEIRSSRLSPYLWACFKEDDRETRAADGAARLVNDAASGVDSGLLCATLFSRFVIVGSVSAYGLMRLNMWILLVAVTVALLSAATTGSTSPALATSIRQVQEGQADLISRYRDVLSKSPSVVLGDRGDRAVVLVRDRAEALRRIALRYSMITYLIGPATSFWTLTGQLAVLLIGGRSVQQAEMSFAEFVALSMYYTLLTPTITALPDFWSKLLVFRSARRRVTEFTTTPAIRHRPATSTRTEPVRRLDLYAQGRRICSLGKGDVLVVEGRSGAGKSYFLKSVIGTLETDGASIVLDGRHARSFLSARRLGAVYYVPQEAPVVFASLDDELGASPDLPAGENSGLARTLLSMTGLSYRLLPPYEGDIGFGGSELSGGERQRLSWVRAACSRRPVVILDEPTAHVDSEYAHVFADILRSYLSDKIVVIATHDEMVKSMAQVRYQVVPAPSANVSATAHPQG
ncbi:ABC transporter ATP-binding protein [Actinomyces lilanjuaniae]|uniref:ABC transporter ATP-binding protein n=1 Tax=Actinomyces lilanjuaniae TaxID=2321394 RepID=A0ABN5PRL4_9ACTO|nr:ABC transporter ATP-binding protein [Actinomyces lilanjuaniae]AYD89497.1 ABC transporter ATP-binding protein [Actinomyces lilanjuaniae]